MSGTQTAFVDKQSFSSNLDILGCFGLPIFFGRCFIFRLIQKANIHLKARFVFIQVLQNPSLTSSQLCSLSIVCLYLQFHSLYVYFLCNFGVFYTQQCRGLDWSWYVVAYFYAWTTTWVVNNALWICHIQEINFDVVHTGRWYHILINDVCVFYSCSWYC